MFNTDVFTTYLNTAPSLPADASVRVVALDPTRSFLVKAPAGAGKTELLTQRFLTMLSTVSEPEDILAITFTNKAGAEMKSRIIRALEFAKNGNEPDMGHTWLTWKIAKSALERSEERGWDILANPGRLRIRTIDAFYGSLVKAAPISGLTGGTNKITDDPEHYYTLAAQEVLGDIESNSDWVDSLEVVLRHCDNRFDRAEELFVNLLSQREQWLPLVLEAGDTENLRGIMESTLKHVFEDKIDSIDKALKPYWTHIQDVASIACLNLDEDSPLKALTDITIYGSADQVGIEPLNGLRDFLLTKDGKLRKSASAAIGFPAPSKAKDPEAKSRLTNGKKAFSELVSALSEDSAAVDALAALRFLPPVSYSDKEWTLLENLLSLLPVLAAKLVLVFRDEGVIDHSEIATGALRVLGEAETPSDLALILDNQLQHVLIDEFQDTNNLQMEGLKRITAGWERGDGRTLFLVGDPQQSIYGFRGSNVGLFIDVEQHGVGDVEITHLSLTVNFRSSAAIINWVNSTFVDVFPSTQDSSLGAIPFSSADVGNTDLSGDGVSVVTVSGDTYEARQHEGQIVADKIKQIREANPDETIGILVRSRGHLTDTLTALKHRDVPCQSIEIDALRDRLSIRDLSSLTRAICHTGDRTAWLSLLRSPMVGLKLSELESIVVCAGRGSIYTAISTGKALDVLDESAANRVTKLITVMRDTEWLRERKPLHTLVEGAWLALGGPATLDSPQDLQNAKAFMELLKKFKYGSFNLERFDRALDKLYALPYATGQNAVQVMTLHKSKGLEFDHVFIPACDRGSRGDDASLLVWDRVTIGGEERPVLATLPEIGSDNAAYDFIRRQESDRRNLEAQRILYVGATRAKLSLHISGSTRTDNDGNPVPPSANSFLGALWPAVSEYADIVGASPAQESKSTGGGFATQPHYVPESCSLPALEENNTLARYRGRVELNTDELPDVAWKVDYERSIGVVMHDILAQACKEGIENYMGNLNRHKNGWQSQLIQLGVPSYYSPNAIQKLESWLKATCSSDTGQWLLDNSHLESDCELELLFMEDGKVTTNAIDRTFIDNGVRWVVDYKMGAKSRAEDDEHYRARMISEHSEQLSGYKTLAASLGDEPVKTALFSVSTQMFIPLEP